MRSYLGLACLIVLAACGGDSSSGPKEPTYPAVAGTYAISGGFDGLTAQEAHFSGNVVISQASREAPALTGTFNVTATVDGDVFLIAGPVQAATVSTEGALSFAVADASTQWSFNGNVSGTAVSGRHTLTDGVDNFSGNWSMQRTGNLEAARAVSAPTGNQRSLMSALNRGTSR